MALLVRSKSTRRVLSQALIASMVLSISGCLVMEQLGWDLGPRSFSHKIHVAGEELACIDCHVGYDKKEEVGMPRLKACMLCHEDFDEEVAPERRAEAFYTDGKYRVSRVNQLDLEIKFSHLEHVTDEQGCLDCHADMVEATSIKPWMAMNMQDCMDCHEQQGQTTDCASCHEQIRAEIAPFSHDGNWDRQHGLSIRGGACPEKTVDQCSLCHTEASCVTCHQDEMPENHNNYWRRRAHGLTARMNRDNCAACHEVAYCDRCHATSEPMSHNGLWGSTKNTHCYGCHESEADQSCNFCHKSGAPSHALAPPKPPGHNPVSDCRSCHQLLQHVDNGDDCNQCHF